ncbi:hypothetical protein G6F22_017602 [Rhizopus arrhizus]|nr:hypothetical protein G6F22_017602 [Rhizopus arrhizus]
MQGVVAARLLPAGRIALPRRRVLLARCLQQRLGLPGVGLRQPGASHGGLQQGQHGADIGAERHGVMAAAGLQIHHVHAMVHAQRRRTACRIRQPRHQGPRQLPQLDAGQQRVAQRQQRRAQPVAAQAAVVAQQAALHQRRSQPRDRRLGQAGAVGQFAVAERRFAMPEGLQQRQAMGQRGGECGVRVAAAQGRGHGRNPESKATRFRRAARSR